MSSKRRLPFDLAELQVFLAVCETKTMVKAAAFLGMTQPAVSHVILEVERRIGTALFDRSIRPIALTPAGTLLHDRAAALMTEAQQIETVMRRSQGTHLPVLRVGLVQSLSRVLSVPLAAALAKSSVQVVLQTGPAAQQTSAMLARELEMLIGVDEKAESDLADVAGLERRGLIEEPYILMTPRGTPHTDLPTLMRQHPFICFTPHSVAGRDIERYLMRIGLTPPRALQFDSPFGVVASVAAGLGWAITTPLCLLEANAPLTSFDLHPLPGPQLKRTLIIVSRPRELGAIPRAAAMVTTAELREQCRQKLHNLPSWITAGMHFGERPAEWRASPVVRPLRPGPLVAGTVAAAARLR